MLNAQADRARQDSIYMDHAATSPLLPEVLEAMTAYLTSEYGNPSTLYAPGRTARAAVTAARRQTAELIGAKPPEIHFTSGGTESDNWALIGAAEALAHRGKHIITSKIEHPAVLKTCEFLESRGYEITRLDVDAEGMIRPEDVRKAVRSDTILISIMTANNEIGTIEPIEEIGQIAKEHQILFHTDAVQAYGHISIDVEKMHIDLLSASAHKIGGPKGTGLLYIRSGIMLPPLLHGGGQERGRRAGTENVAGIVGFGAAAVCRQREDGMEVGRLQSCFWKTLSEKIPAARLNGPAPGEKRLPGNLSISFRGQEAELMLAQLDQRRIYVSAGSACSSGSLEPSHVLAAIGGESIGNTLRFSFDHTNTKEQIDRVIKALQEILQQ